MPSLVHDGWPSRGAPDWFLTLKVVSQVRAWQIDDLSTLSGQQRRRKKVMPHQNMRCLSGPFSFLESKMRPAWCLSNPFWQNLIFSNDKIKKGLRGRWLFSPWIGANLSLSLSIPIVLPHIDSSLRFTNVISERVTRFSYTAAVEEAQSVAKNRRQTHFVSC